MGIIVEQQIIEAGAMLTQLLCVQFPTFERLQYPPSYHLQHVLLQLQGVLSRGFL